MKKERKFNLRKLLKDLEISQSDLAREMKISRQAVCKWCGKVKPHEYTCEKILNGVGGVISKRGACKDLLK